MLGSISARDHVLVRSFTDLMDLDLEGKLCAGRAWDCA